MSYLYFPFGYAPSLPSTAYSQSGLVSHWDAINNVLDEGVRSHSSTTTTWYDLTGNGYNWQPGFVISVR